MNWLAHDVRYSVREAARRPGFTALAVLTLAFGIGAVTMMYSVIQSVLLNPFPYTDPRRMVDVIVQDTQTPQGGIRGALTIPEFRAYVDESGVFEEAVGANLTDMLYRTEEGTEQFSVAALTPNSFRFLGVPALLGRAFNEDDAKTGAPPVAVLSHKAWMTYFSGDPAILGRQIVLDNQPATVIGVMPPHFTWHVADVWLPDAARLGDPDAMKKGFWLQGRIKRNLTQEEAQAQLNVIGARLARLYPDRFPKKFTIQVITVIDWVVGKFRWVLYTLLGAVGLLLLIACCNVANMLLARATTREREIAIRAALGATRGRIMGQLLVESLLLALSGGLIGIALGYGGTRWLTQFIPPYTIPVETVITVNTPVMLFSLAVATLTALIFGVVPALHSTRRDLAPSLSSSGKGADSGGRQGGLRNLLVVSEVALSLVLLTGAAILMRSFLSMVNLDLGFNPANILMARVAYPHATPAERNQFFEAALPRLASLPGVVAASVTTTIPPYGGYATEIEIQGKTHAERWSGQLQLCGDTQFQTMGYRFLSGAPFSHGDVASGRKVAVVNQTFVSRYFGQESPLGAQIRLARLTTVPGGIPDPIYEIVGVVADIRNQGLEQPAAPEAMIPYTTITGGFPWVLVRTSSDARGIANAVRREIRAVNRNIIQRDPMTLAEALRDRAYARPRFSVLLMSVFAAIGLILVGTGVYGVMAYAVSQRTREIGIRMALGAERGQVFRDVVGRALRMIGAGVVLGTLASLATNRVISSQIWTVTPFDPVALLAAVAAIVMLGAAASYVPALRATRVNPIVALRHE